MDKLKKIGLKVLRKLHKIIRATLNERIFTERFVKSKYIYLYIKLEK